MRLSIVNGKNSKALIMIKSTYENGKHSSKVVEKFGNIEHLKEKLNLQTEEEVIAWAKDYIAKATAQEKENNQKIIEETIQETQTSLSWGFRVYEQVYY